MSWGGSVGTWESKGVKCVGSRGKNVRAHLPQDCSLLEFKSLLLQCIFGESGMTQYHLTEQEQQQVCALRDGQYSTWEWNYGRSPACSVIKKARFEGCGTVEVRMNIQNGFISEIFFFGDFFSTIEPDALADRFIGIRPTRDAFELALEDVSVEHYFTKLSKPELLGLLAN